jgi:hypothetical protein
MKRTVSFLIYGSPYSKEALVMEQTKLGRSGLVVSRIAFGTWQLGGEWGATDEAEAVAAIRRAADVGVTLFDTAQGYGFGASERLLAKALDGDRDGLVVATKGGLRPADGGGVARDASPAWIRRGVEESLRALETDALDLYQVHWPDAVTPFEATATALAKLVEEGKVRHVGVSNFSAEQVEEFSETLPVETLQPPYHLLNDRSRPRSSRTPITTTSASWSTDRSRTGSSAVRSMRTHISRPVTGGQAARTSAARATRTTSPQRLSLPGSPTTSSGSVLASLRSRGR